MVSVHLWAAIALSSMLANESSADEKQNPLAPRKGHLPAKAKNCIFLMMEGGPSHVDTFDPKPALDKLHLKAFTRSGKQKSAMESGKRYYVKSPFKFNKHGESGADMADNWRHLSAVADDLCFYRGCQVDSVNHPTAMYQMNCGNRFGGDPGIGAWVTYGLGTENQDLPGYIVLPDVSYPQGGAPNWSNGYLPAFYQGTPLRPKGSPILDLSPPEGITRERQRMNLDLLSKFNRHTQTNILSIRNSPPDWKAMSLLTGLQTEVPNAIDLSDESEKTLAMYGVGNDATDSFGRKCLLARKMVEKGVRFVQLFNGSWDSHDYIERRSWQSRPWCRSTDRGLDSRPQSTRPSRQYAYVWCGEFGRTPDNGVRGGIAYGRDHNPNAMTIWMAGGGCKAGHHHWSDR